MTGYDGYIGAVMIPALLDDGHEIVGLDTGYFSGCDFGEFPVPIDTLNRDLRDVTRQDLQGMDAVIHLAAISNDALGDLNPQCTYDINHLASVRLGELA